MHFIFITFLLKYFSNFRRPTAIHCSHWLGRLFSSLMTWKDPSRLSPAFILYTCTKQACITSQHPSIKWLLKTRVSPVAPLQEKDGSARRSCTWRACGQMRSQTRSSQDVTVRSETELHKIQISAGLHHSLYLSPTEWCARWQKGKTLACRTGSPLLGGLSKSKKMTHSWAKLTADVGNKPQIHACSHGCCRTLSN